MSKNDGGRAFPRPRSEDPEQMHKPETYHAQEGMSLRAWIATQAIVPMVAHRVSGHVSYGNEQDMAKRACEIADALIAALEAS